MINKSIAQILLGALLVAGVNYSGQAQTTKPTTPATQPTPSMQEQYDKLHGTTPKKTTTQPSKSKTTTKPQTTQKPAKTPSVPKPEVVEKPKAAPKADGGFKFSVGQTPGR
jgi:outer membrane biosynthesis protein TonB